MQVQSCRNNNFGHRLVTMIKQNKAKNHKMRDKPKLILSYNSEIL